MSKADDAVAHNSAKAAYEELALLPHSAVLVEVDSISKFVTLMKNQGKDFQ